ncbi:MAG: hypothetical protein OEM25_00435 [Gammaproteobacteria bacterium]|nr:hypothetical protein [Gammaproteobacteria bacterium]
MSNAPTQQKARLQLVLIAIVFLGPLLVAGWLYFKGNPLQPSGRSNHGALLEPIISIRETLPDSVILNLEDTAWLLLYPNTDGCDEGCKQALYTIRQSRLMLGREMDRLQRVMLHGESLPDTVFLAEEQPGLITIEDSKLIALLNNKRPTDLPAGGYYLVDPLGNLVMYFHPDLDPAEMVDDIKHLLRLSRIG